MDIPSVFLLVPGAFCGSPPSSIRPSSVSSISDISDIGPSRRNRLAAEVWESPRFRRGLFRRLETEAFPSCLALSRVTLKTGIRVLYKTITFDDYLCMKEVLPTFKRYKTYLAAVRCVDITHDLPRLNGISGFPHLLDIFPLATTIKFKTCTLLVDRCHSPPTYTLHHPMILRDTDFREFPPLPKTHFPPTFGVKQVLDLEMDAEECWGARSKWNGQAVPVHLRTLAVLNDPPLLIGSLKITHENYGRSLVDDLIRLYSKKRYAPPATCWLSGQIEADPEVARLPYRLDELFRAIGPHVEVFQLHASHPWTDIGCYFELDKLLSLEWDHFKKLRHVDLSCRLPKDTVDETFIPAGLSTESAYLENFVMPRCPFDLSMPNISRPLPNLSSFTLRLGQGEFENAQDTLDALWSGSEWDNISLPMSALAKMLLAIGGPLCEYTLLLGPTEQEIKDDVDDLDEYDGHMQTLELMGNMWTRMLRQEIELEVERLAQPRGWRKLDLDERVPLSMMVTKDVLRQEESSDNC